MCSFVNWETGSVEAGYEYKSEFYGLETREEVSEMQVERNTRDFSTRPEERDRFKINLGALRSFLRQVNYPDLKDVVEPIPMWRGYGSHLVGVPRLMDIFGSMGWELIDHKYVEDSGFKRESIVHIYTFKRRIQ